MWKKTYSWHKRRFLMIIYSVDNFKNIDFIEEKNK